MAKINATIDVKNLEEVKQMFDELKEKLDEYKEAIDYILTAKPEHYHDAKNMLEDFKVVIGSFETAGGKRSEKFQKKDG